jgi:pyrimidine-nucleoside phosphorylase
VVRQAARTGLALTGQTPRLAPADKRLYSLRDQTGTVPSVPLITASILSKKIAGGADTVVLDVKCGSGAFMADLGEAERLRESLESVGRRAGLTVRSLVTDMDQPLGVAVGNALEVEEALAALRGEGPPRFLGLCCELAGAVLAGGADEARAAVASGSAYSKAREWFLAQGADWAAVEKGGWAEAPVRLVAECPEDGWASRVDARAVGEAALALGAGRSGREGEVDPRVGIEVLVEVGQAVSAGQPAFRVHARSEDEAAAAASRCLAGLEASAVPVPARPPVLSRPSPS